MFLQDSAILQMIADTLNQTVAAQVQPKTNNIIAEKHQAAYQIIVSKLLGRGFTLAQINQWDRGAEFEGELALYLCLVRIGMLEAYGVEFLDRICHGDKRDPGSEIDKLSTISINGVWTEPNNDSNESPGVFGSGSFDTSQDIFGPPDSSNDPRRGRPMRF
jgi:hypothetical protein